jgi:uncharacterized membrane protein YhiD involved in acid resistance
MELLTQAGLGIVALSLVAAFISFSVSSMSEKSYRRMTRKSQRDRNERHIAELKAELRLLSRRVSKLES